jgi:hypothetical protein
MSQIVFVFPWLIGFFGITGCMLGFWLLFSALKSENKELNAGKGQIKLFSGLFMLSASILTFLFFDYVVENEWVLIIISFLVIAFELILPLYFKNKLEHK